MNEIKSDVNIHAWMRVAFSVLSLADRIFLSPIKPLKVGHSDMAFRPRFRNGSDALSTPSSTPTTPSSWPPRPASTRLGQTCVAGHVGSFLAWVSSLPLKPHVVTPVVMSSWPSWVVLKAREGSKMNLK